MIINKISITLISGLVINILISYYDTLPDNRDFLFKPELSKSYYLDYNGGIYTHIIDLLISFV